MKMRKENKECAKNCLAALQKHYDPKNTLGTKPSIPDCEVLIVDMLADLRHVCDMLNLPFHEIDHHAFGHYNAERNGEK